MDAHISPPGPAAGTHPGRWRRRSVTLLALAVLVAAPLGTTAAADGHHDPASSVDHTLVRTEDGAVRGTADDEVRRFQGIPFAAPPVGDLRWQDPQPPSPWDGVRDATAPGPACAQGDGEVPGGSSAENCLYLNVTTPARESHEPLPVIVWFHGGGFYMGAGHNYDPQRLVTGGDVIVVTTNYRLGVFGNYGHPGLDGSGTFGLSDQQAALSWVQDNAAAFGGDPDNVTIAGQSAGAVSGCAHLTSPSAGGLFDAAIMQSGSCGVEWLANSVYRGEPADSILLPSATVEARGQEAAASLGCSTDDPAAALACLRDLPVEALMPWHGAFIQPAYGNELLPTEPAAALREGRFHRVPVLSGHTRDESTLPVSMYEDGAGPMSEETYDAVMTETFGQDEEKVSAEYPRAEYDSGAAVWAAIVTDSKWATSQLDVARTLSRRVPVYQYEFADPAPPLGIPGPPPMRMGAYHTSDLWSFFDLAGHSPQFTPEQQRLSEQMIEYWATFAATGRPDAADGPRWPAFGTHRHHLIDGDSGLPARPAPYVQRLAPGAGGIGPVDVAKVHHLRFWEQFDR
ncbi:carboxylesterase family protein [Georgenia sp. MJ173]|uniref:carboxylesterase/lipase family protein n=1 Tax=Georgenia sunbinii TaxID=3117728 RepID=UPI002F261B88